MDDQPLEPSDTYITLARAAQLSGLAAGTLRVLSNPRDGKEPRLRTVRLGHDRLTTRRWLHEYLMGRDGRNQQAAPLPPDYVAQE